MYKRFTRNFRIILAVFQVRVITFTRYPLNFWSALVTPFIPLAVSFFLAKSLTVARSGAPGSSAFSDYRGFILTSTVIWTYIQGQLFMSFSLESEMRRGTMETVFLSPVPRWCYLAGHGLYQMARSTLDAVAAVLLGVLVFGVAEKPNWPVAMAVFLLNLLAVYGYGLILSGAIILFKSDVFSYAWDTLLPLCVGEAYSITVLPAYLQKVARLIPFTYGLDLARWAATGYPTFMPVGQEMAILATSAFVMPFVGLMVFAWLERAVKVKGSLGQF